jgi:phage tail sheath protein FI
MPNYQTPGVYIEEIASFPPSVAQVATAIPVFIGYTEKGQGTHRISTLLEYETLLGGPATKAFTVSTESENLSITSNSTDIFSLYYQLSLFFKNGGGTCYIISIGNYSVASPKKSDYETGLQALEREDEPTIILFSDIEALSSVDYYDIYQQALNQAAKLGDRFVIIDVPDKEGVTKDIEAFRNGALASHLRYGAAYYPNLQTTLTYQYEDDGVSVLTDTQNTTETVDNSGDSENNTTVTTSQQTTITLASIKDTETALYNQIRSVLDKQRVILPPSAAMAGIYARVDGSRGVWKAPANEAIHGSIAPIRKITQAEQEGMNIDATAGKSVNALREFIGKGTLVWGARTLAGNDNEWRYVSVRRLFNLVEESTQKATAFAVFEANDSTTWLKVKAMIESFLYSLWEQGAMSGATAEEAYFVNIGLGKTMTSQDVLEGRMNVEIGIAAVRPAEFIVLRFMHKLQEA